MNVYTDLVNEHFNISKTEQLKILDELSKKNGDNLENFTDEQIDVLCNVTFSTKPNNLLNVIYLYAIRDKHIPDYLISIIGKYVKRYNVVNSN